MPPPPLTHKTLDFLASSSFCRVADARQFAGNAIRLLCDGPQNYAAWLSAIAEAERTVHLENYLVQEDATGQAFADALIKAARRGVKCRVLYDWLGCRSKTSRRFWRTLREGGVEVRCYNPPQADNLLRWVSRNHRKVLTIDSQTGYTGGLCIGQNWAGHPAQGIPPWRDTAIEIRGPAAAYLSQAFADSWATAGPPIDSMDLPPPESVEAQGNIRLWVIAGHPDSMGLYRLEQLVTEIVEQSLWLADAYFVATTGYVRALTGAARAGVDVRLLVPSAGDLPIVRAISRSAYRPLLEAGVRVFEWNGPMMHAKTAVADGRWSRIGSSNSNLASWIANRELDVTIHDPAFAGTMAAMYEHDLENATEIVLRKGRIGRSGPNGAEAAGSGTGGAFVDRAPMPPREGRLSGGVLPGTTSRLLAGAIGFGSAVGATLARHRVIGPSESRIAAAAGLLLLGLALTALLLPRLIAYPIGVIAAWVGLTFLIEAGTLMMSTRTPPE
jgi:cardiolipin synthase